MRDEETLVTPANNRILAPHGQLFPREEGWLLSNANMWDFHGDIVWMTRRRKYHFLNLG